VWPSLAGGLFLPTLAGVARRDVELVETAPLPGGPLRVLGRFPDLWTWCLVAVAVAIAVVFGYLRPGIGAVYTESTLFLGLAVALGMFSPAAAVLMLLLFMPLDLLNTWQGGLLDPLIPAIAGRIVSWWLLFVLAAAIPLVCRGIPAAVIARHAQQVPIIRRLLGYVAAALIAGVLVWFWTQATQFLIRPVFAWSNLRTPPVAAVESLHTSWEDVVTAALVSLMAFTLLRDALGSLDDEANDIRRAVRAGGPGESRLLPDEWLIASQILGAVFLTMTLGGLITQAIDVVVLFGTLLVAGPAIRFALTRLPIVVRLLTRIPWLFRFMLGALLGYLAALAINGAWEGQQTASDFFPMVVAVAVGLFLFELFLEADLSADELEARRDELDEPAASAPPAPAGAVPALGISIGASVLIALAVLAWTPAPANAADCTTGFACAPTAADRAAVSEGAAAIVAVATMAAARHVSQRQNAMRLRRRRRRRPPRATDPVMVQVGALAPNPGSRVADLVSRARDRALDNYRRG
jgi:hypothetical protein